MQVDILINPRARQVNGAQIERELRSALFRCELTMHSPSSVAETQALIERRAMEGTDFFVICGGDGTLNVAVHPLMKARKKLSQNGRKLPPVCVIPSGTANDLASELGISRRIHRAARAILEGGVKLVDILEIKARGENGAKTAYMITNGGIGIPSQTADKANLLRQWIRAKAEDESVHPLLQTVFKAGRLLVHAAGSRIYEMLLVGDLGQWDQSHWEVEIDIPGKTSFVTKAPFIMINNQPSLGAKFRLAPFTSNSDGTFNILLIQPTELMAQAKAILDIRRGRIPDLGDCPSFEAQSIKLRALESSRTMTFFGDGEILHRDAREISIRCLHPGLPIVTGECSDEPQLGPGRSR